MRENIYGHRRRLEWIRARLGKEQRVAEVGCGTGYMITLPLALQGYDIQGADTDELSIRQGRELFAAAGADASRLARGGLRDLEGRFDAVIASEVLEHVPDGEFAGVFAEIRGKLEAGGALLVTVPNGRGWFEAESFLWHRAGLGRLLEKLRLDIFWRRVKRLLGAGEEDMTPSTYADSPHRQRFSRKSIRRLLEGEGFEVIEIAGSVLLAGPFSNLFLSGFAPAMRLNAILGERLPGLAAGWYIRCRLASPGEAGGGGGGGS